MTVMTMFATTIPSVCRMSLEPEAYLVFLIEIPIANVLIRTASSFGVIIETSILWFDPSGIKIQLRI